MAYQIIQKKRFLNKVIKLLTYLEKEWNNKVAYEFLIILDTKLEQLSDHPFIGKSSRKTTNIRALLITKHNILYYKIIKNEVIILNMFDTRMNPNKNPY